MFVLVSGKIEVLASYSQNDFASLLTIIILAGQSNIRKILPYLLEYFILRLRLVLISSMNTAARNGREGEDTVKTHSCIPFFI